MPRVVSLVLLVLVALAAPASAQRHRISVPPEIAKMYQDYPVVELVTMGVGSLIWERHGHIALCVRYADHSQDACYNYGIGDFHHPIAMGAGFFRGSNSFWVGKMNPDEMLSIYRYADRTIWVQPLPLTAEQKQQVIDKLEHDILDANRYYAYDHFWDNCTTRVRDIIDNVTNHALSTMPEIDDQRTYRDLAREGFLGMRIPLLITDLAMGRVTDRRPSYWERMFLPDYLREAVATKWGIQPIAIYERRGPPSLQELAKQLERKDLAEPERQEIQRQIDDYKSSPSGRVLLALFVILITAPVWATRLWRRFERAGLWFALVPQVFLGTVFWFLAIISPLPYVRWNESCLVFLPFDLAMLFLAADKRRLYARGRVAMLGVIGLLLLVGVLKQPLWSVLLWPGIPAAVVGFWPEPPVESEPATVSERPKRKRGKKRSS